MKKREEKIVFQGKKRNDKMGKKRISKKEGQS